MVVDKPSLFPWKLQKPLSGAWHRRELKGPLGGAGIWGMVFDTKWIYTTVQSIIYSLRQILHFSKYNISSKKSAASWKCFSLLWSPDKFLKMETIYTCGVYLLNPKLGQNILRFKKDNCNLAFWELECWISKKNPLGSDKYTE